MASNHTTNYGLSQWVRTDKVLMDDFNADNAKIDAALAGKASVSVVNGLQASVSSLNSGKASQAALDALQTTVNGKASQSALDALSKVVSEHTSALGAKGNCILAVTSYTGDGVTSTRKSLTFSGQPQLVLISGGNGYLVLVQGSAYAPAALGSLYQNLVFWTGNSVSWSHSGSGGAAGMMNASGSTYVALALLKAD